jgi:hypothetical protein
MSAAGKVAPLQVGFGKVGLWGTWQTSRRLADDIDVRVLAAWGEGPMAALVVTDLQCLPTARCTRFRQAVAEALGTGTEQVAVFTTQNHGVDWEDGAFDHARIEAACVQAARAAAADLRPVRAAAVTVHPDRPLNVCRRVEFGEFGAFTFWFGFHLDDAGRARSDHLLKLACAELAKGNPDQVRCLNVKGLGPQDYDAPAGHWPVPEPSYMPPPHDDAIQGVFFQDLAGQPVGSLLRFPAHPAAANRGDGDYHSGDYPAYARRRLEQRFGGMAVFLTGPCGNQAPLVARKSLDRARQIGEDLADRVLAKLPQAAWETGGRVAAVAPQVTLRVRPQIVSLPREQAEARAKAVEARIRQLSVQHTPLPAIKRLTDEYECLMQVATAVPQQWCGLDVRRESDRRVVQPLFVMRLGPCVVAGLPGEPFADFSAELRDRSCGDSLIVAEECNGYLGYIPDEDDFAHGSYEVNAALFEPGTGRMLVEAILKALPAV